MKYLYIDSASIDEIVNGRTYQSTEFEDAKFFIKFIRGETLEISVSSKCIGIQHSDGFFLISPDVKSENYLVIDLEQADTILELDDIGLLLACQKALRFCKKSWANLTPSKHERILSNGKAAVFPYPIGQQTSLRISIDRQPDEKRRSRRESGQAYLIYKFSDNEGQGPTETPQLTNFRKAIEVRDTAYKQARKKIVDQTENHSSISSIAITELSPQNIHLQENGLDNWQKWLTNSQKHFVNSKLSVPHRIEGPAGTGKTLCLVLKAIKQFEELSKDQPAAIHKSLFVTHSQATKTTIENLFATNGGSAYLGDYLESSRKSLSILVTTLHELCAFLLQKEISDVELIDKDAYESKLTQKLYANEAVERIRANELTSHRPYLSNEFQAFIDSTDNWAIAEMLQHEVSVQIKGRADQDLTKYKKLPQLKFGMPLKNEGDRSLVFLMYEEYQKELEAAAQFDTDDVVLSAISQLGTPIWRRRRVREGFDSIFIDETHLFNLNELSIFHKLTKQDARQPIAYSVDRSQALGDRGWTSEAFEDAFVPTDEQHKRELTNVKSIFRCSPEIIDLAFSVTSSGATLFTNFHNPLTSAVSTFSADEERRAKKPEYIDYASDGEMYTAAFSRAEAMARELNCQKADIAIIAFGDECFERAQATAIESKKPVEIIKSRGDIKAVAKARQSGKLVLSSPEFVGGLEFYGVILVGVDLGRVPPTIMGVDESQAFLSYTAHQKLYVSITRAKYRVDILGNKARGISPSLYSARAAQLIDIIRD